MKTIQHINHSLMSALSLSFKRLEESFDYLGRKLF